MAVGYRTTANFFNIVELSGRVCDSVELTGQVCHSLTSFKFQKALGAVHWSVLSLISFWSRGIARENYVMLRWVLVYLDCASRCVGPRPGHIQAVHDFL